jgi:hypothetical protein
MDLASMPDLSSRSAGQGIRGRQVSTREPVTPCIDTHDEAV